MMLRFTKAAPRTANERSKDERGIFLPLVAVMLFTLMGMIGLAVDSGNLYLARISLQKAADAAAIGSAKRFATEPFVARDANFPARMRNDVELIVKANLDAANGTNLSAAEVGAMVDPSPALYDRANETVTVRLGRDVRLWILGNLPGYRRSVTVSVSAKAQVRKAMVSLVFDTSLSMICPTTGDNCDCSKKPVPDCADPKILRLLHAAKDFVDLFNPNRDMFDLTLFSVAAANQFYMYPNGGFDKDHPTDGLVGRIDAIDDGINTLIRGSTNTCDGLFLSYYNTQWAERGQHRGNVARVLFTDGAPAAARFFFAGALPSLPLNNFLGKPYSNYDYYVWAIDWLTNAQYVGTDLTSARLPGVTQLAKAPIPMSWTKGIPPGIPPGAQYWQDQYPNGLDSTVGCSPQILYNVGDTPDPARSFNVCLNDLSFMTPDGRVWGGGIQWSQYREQFYHCAIKMSDFIRSEGSVVYAVSIGADPGVFTDAYQDVRNDHVRKDCFLTRVANDPIRALSACLTYDFPRPFARADIVESNHQTQGTYISAPDATNLPSLFKNQLYPRLARKLKTAVLVPG